jgi:class 3 adenylate cyclase/tetratricopeptide (TPR) repeat protein
MRCSSCTEELDVQDRFCRWCGASIGENVVRLVPQIERRFATVLFADIVDSTAMVVDLEPDLALERVSPILEAMKQTITEHGGTICRDQGDGIMASFGAPLADDRHAVNACLAGMALLTRTAAAVPFRVVCRVGLHSGTIVGHMTATSSGLSYGVSGEAVHLAARLETAADVGTVLISEATHRLTNSRFAARARRFTTLKGFHREITAYELLHQDSPARWAATTLHTSVEFCGRDQELAELGTAYRDSELDGALVCGDPAVGKTRLLHALIDAHVPTSTVLHAVSCEENLLRTPYATLRRLVLGMLGVSSDAPAEQVELALLAHGRQLDGPGQWDERALYFVLGLPIADRQWAELEAVTKRRRIVTSVAELLRRSGANLARPIVLIDDIHWADSASVAVLNAVREHLPRGSIFLLMTSRDADAVPARLQPKDSTLLLRLEPLGAAACERILDSLLGRSQTLLRLKGRVLELGGGIPLFIQQIVQWLSDTRALVGSPGNYRLAVHADQLQLPTSLQAVTLWRVDRLPAQTRQVLLFAAVLQDDVGVPAIAFMSGLPTGQIQAEVELLLDRGLLVRRTEGEAPSFAFRHALLRESIYESLTRDRRSELHAAALSFLETAPSDGHTYRDGLLAIHAFASQNWSLTAKYAQVVGARAIAASAWREAAGHFEHAVDALYRLPRDRQTLSAAIDARLQARVCYSAMAKHDLCLSHITRAAELARELGDQQRLLACTIYRAGVLNFTGPVHESLTIGTEALRQAEVMDSVPHIAIAGFALGQAYYASGNFREAIEAFAAGSRRLTGDMALMRLGLTGTAAAMCAALQAASHASLGEFTNASTCLALAGDVARRTGRPYDIVSYAYGEGIMRSLQGDDAAAIAAFERALETCRTGDIETYVTTIAGQLGRAYIAAGRVDEALVLLEAALEEAHALQNLPQIATLKRQLGFAAYAGVDLVRADKLAAEAVSIAGGGGYRMIEAAALHLQAMIALRRGESLGLGLVAAERSIEIARSIGATPALVAMEETWARLSALSLRASRRPDVAPAFNGVTARPVITTAIPAYLDIEPSRPEPAGTRPGTRGTE